MSERTLTDDEEVALLGIRAACNAPGMDNSVGEQAIKDAAEWAGLPDNMLALLEDKHLIHRTGGEFQLTDTGEVLAGMLAAKRCRCQGGW